MIATLPSSNTVTTASLLASVEALREVARAHAVESERLRTLAPPVVAALRASGLLGMAVPTELGGAGRASCAQLAVCEAAARVDTSLGWSLMISSMLAAIAGAYLQGEAARALFANGIPTFAGLLSASGTLRPVRGGFRVDGRWAFGSGIRHADWVVTSAVLPREPEPTVNEPPQMITVVVPASEVRIEDTWHSAGLRGSGSEHYRLEDVFVPATHTFAFPAAPALRGGPTFDLPLIALLAPAHAGFALGAARALLDGLQTVAPLRVKSWGSAPLASHAGFHMELGRADTRLRAARALAYEAAEQLELRVQAGEPLSLEDWRAARTSVTYATEVAADLGSFALRSAGASALYEASPLQRLFRDVHAALQHVAATDEAYEFAGRLLLGSAAPHPLIAPRAPRPDTRAPA